tara:strand:- start:1049 stop:1465 length:417 start_codon:yes stop_codon:yes gene_type:complete
MKSETNFKQNIVSFYGQPVTKSEIIAKLQDELEYCKEKRQDTLRFFFHYQTGQMQMIDTNTQFREVKELYKSQGYSFAGQHECVGIKPEQIGPACMSLKYNLYRGHKTNPVDPLSMLCGYMPSETEMVILEMRINYYI